MDTNSRWVGWLYFAGVYMVTVGIFQMLAGFAALYRQNVIAFTAESALFVSLETYGWTLLLVGLLMLLTGLGIMAGQLWARIVGVVLAVIAAVANFLFIPVYPIWSTIVVVLDVVVIYALIAHGSEISEYQEV